MEMASHPAVHPVALPPPYQAVGPPAPPAVRINDFPGSPGTLMGLALRFAQLGFALTALCIMVSIVGFSSVTAFWCESSWSQYFDFFVPVSILLLLEAFSFTHCRSLFHTLLSNEFFSFCSICTCVVQFSCCSYGIAMHLEPVFGSFGLLCVVDKAVPSKLTDSELLCCWWLGKRLMFFNHALMTLGVIHLERMHSWWLHFCRIFYWCFFCIGTRYLLAQSYRIGLLRDAQTSKLYYFIWWYLSIRHCSKNRNVLLNFATMTTFSMWNSLLTSCKLENQITSTMTFAGACAAAGITVLIDNDLNQCGPNHCNRFEAAAAMAFMSWVITTISFFLSFWILVTCR